MQRISRADGRATSNRGATGILPRKRPGSTPAVWNCRPCAGATLRTVTLALSVGVGIGSLKIHAPASEKRRPAPRRQSFATCSFRWRAARSALRGDPKRATRRAMDELPDEHDVLRDAMDDGADPARISAARQALATLAGELDALLREVEGG